MIDLSPLLDPAQSRLRAGNDLRRTNPHNGHRPSELTGSSGERGPAPVDARAGSFSGIDPGSCPTFWRVEGSLVEMTAVRPVAHFTWNAHTFTERWARRSGLFLEALVRPVLYAANRVFATRVLHALLRDVT